MLVAKQLATLAGLAPRRVLPVFGLKPARPADQVAFPPQRLSKSAVFDESVTFYLDGNQYFSVSESQVGTATWQAAFDHNLSIILDLAMGGGYPNGVCGCTTPTSPTSSGGTMSVAYVAAYQTTSGSGGGGGGGAGGGTGTTGQMTGYGGLCIDDRSASTANFNPVRIYTCNGTAAQQ